MDIREGDPLINIFPTVGSIKPQIKLIKVDLPDPDWPQLDKIRLLSSFRFIFSKTFG